MTSLHQLLLLVSDRHFGFRHSFGFGYTYRLAITSWTNFVIAKKITTNAASAIKKTTRATRRFDKNILLIVYLKLLGNLTY